MFRVTNGVFRRRTKPHQATAVLPLRSRLSLLGLRDGHVLEQLPFVARLPHGVETVVHDLRGRRAGGWPNDAEARSQRERRLFGWIALARLSRERPPRRVRRGSSSDRRAGGWAYLFTDERAGDDDGDVHARALRAEELRRGTRRSRSDSIEGARVYFVVGAARGPSRQGFGSRRSRRGTHRHRGLIERFEHGVRGCFSEEAFARFGLCQLASRGGRGKADRTLLFLPV